MIPVVRRGVDPGVLQRLLQPCDSVDHGLPALRGDTAVEEARAPGQLGRGDAEERRVPGQRIGQARRAAVQTEIHAEGSFLRATAGGDAEGEVTAPGRTTRRDCARG